MKPMPLEGLCHEMNNLLKVIKVKSVPSVHAPIGFRFLACFVQEKDMNKVSACLFVNTYKFKNHQRTYRKYWFNF